MIMVANFPIMWQSQLHSDTVLSTIEAEIIALSQSCWNVFSIMDQVGIMGKAIGPPVGNTTIQGSIHEDNTEALIIAKSLPPQFTSE